MCVLHDFSMFIVLAPMASLPLDACSIHKETLFQHHGMLVLGLDLAFQMYHDDCSVTPISLSLNDCALASAALLFFINACRKKRCFSYCGLIKFSFTSFLEIFFRL